MKISKLSRSISPNCPNEAHQRLQGVETPLYRYYTVTFLIFFLVKIPFIKAQRSALLGKQFLLSVFFCTFFFYTPLHAASLFSKQDPHTLKVVGRELWPYASEVNKRREGYVLEVLKLIFGKKGYKLTYEAMPWPRALLSAKANVHQIIVGISHPEKYKKLLFPKHSIGMMGNGLFGRSTTDWYYDGIGSLKGKSIGIIKDYTFGIEFDGYFEEHKSDLNMVQIAMGVNALEINLKKLAIGRIDLIFDDVQSVLGTAEKMGISDKIKPVGFDNTFAIYVAFSAKNPEAKKLLQIFDQSIHSMRQNGKLQKILDRYQLDDWQ